MKKKILIIEDEYQAFNNIKTLCEGFGYSVLPYNFEQISRAINDGCVIEFVTQQVKEHYKDLKLVICDTNIGDLYEGNKIIKSIRTIRELDSTYLLCLPIIAITNFSDRQAQILWAGADFSITKHQFFNDPIFLGAIIETRIKKFEKNIDGLFINNNKVLIVQGNLEIGRKVVRFLDCLSLQPIILHEVEPSDNGITIIERIERYSDVGYAIILYTSSDLGKSKNETDMKDRARQNVVFEHGYMTAKLGRENVCILVEQGVELPGDISGLVYVPLDDSGAWKLQLAENMKKRGFDIDMNKVC